MSIGQLFFKQSAIFSNNNTELNIIYKYLKILSEMKISIAYPILSISYILTAIGAYYIFQERLTALNMVGIFFIMLGVSLISIK